MSRSRVGCTSLQASGTSRASRRMGGGMGAPVFKNSRAERDAYAIHPYLLSINQARMYLTTYRGLLAWSARRRRCKSQQVCLANEMRSVKTGGYLTSTNRQRQRLLPPSNRCLGWTWVQEWRIVCSAELGKLLEAPFIFERRTCAFGRSLRLLKNFRATRRIASPATLDDDRLVS